MIGYFRSIRLNYYLGGIAGVLVLFLLFATTGQEGAVRPLLPFGFYLGSEVAQGLLPLALMAVWVFFWRYACGRQARKKLYKIMDYLLQDCEPQRFLDALRPLLPKKPRYKGARLYLYLLLVTGLLEAGEYDEAKQVLNGFDQFPKNATGSGYRFSYYNNRFRYYHAMGEPEDCSIALARMKELLTKAPIHPSMYRVYDNAYDQKKALYKLETGDWSEAEEVYARMLNNARHEIDRITARLVLGRVCLMNGRTEEAWQHFEYVAAKDKTVEGRQARELLAGMEGR